MPIEHLDQAQRKCKTRAKFDPNPWNLMALFSCMALRGQPALGLGATSGQMFSAPHPIADIEQWGRYVGERRIDVVEFIAICRAIPADSAAILAKVAKLV
jgi:hypothetical protein